MSILVNKNTRLMVQGITGKEGSYHAQRSAEYGANLVAGVTPGKGGQQFMDSVPVFDTVQEGVKKTDADASLIFVMGGAIIVTSPFFFLLKNKTKSVLGLDFKLPEKKSILPFMLFSLSMGVGVYAPLYMALNISSLVYFLNSSKYFSNIALVENTT